MASPPKSFLWSCAASGRKTSHEAKCAFFFFLPELDWVQVKIPEVVLGFLR